MKKFKKGDKVVVIQGKDKGKSGSILSVDFNKQVLVIDGINQGIRHMKPTQDNQQGGRVTVNLPIDWSNVLHEDPKTKKPTRISIQRVDGKRIRKAKSSGETIG